MPIGAHGEIPEQEKPAVLPSEFRGFLLRRTGTLRPLPTKVGGREETADLTGKKWI